MNAETINAIINRHIARLMTNLDDADCPLVFQKAVKSELQWLRSDIAKEMADLTTEKPDAKTCGSVRVFGRDWSTPK